MFLRIRLVLVIKAIIAINWLLGKLTSFLCAQNIIDISNAPKDPVKKVLMFVEPTCSLDVCFDFEHNSRDHLKTWQYR